MHQGAPDGMRRRRKARIHVRSKSDSRDRPWLIPFKRAALSFMTFGEAPWRSLVHE